MPAIDH